MTYEKAGLTVEIEREVQGKWVKVVAESVKSLPKTDLGDASEKVIDYLRDKTSQHTSDFIIRRHLQKCYPKFLQEAQEKSGQTYVDLTANKNMAWSDAYNQALAEILHKRLPGNISKKQWFLYLSNHCRIQKKQLYKVALILGMDVETTQKLLMACGKEPYNLHFALDIICWYCQKHKKDNAYNAFVVLCEKYENGIGEDGTRQKMQERKENYTPGITMKIQSLIDGKEDDRHFLESLVRYTEKFTGYSITLWSKYLHFARYLLVFYPDYNYTHSYREYYAKSGQKKANIQNSECVKPVDSYETDVQIFSENASFAGMQKRKVPDLNKLLTAMFGDVGWFDGNKAHGKKETHIAKVQKDAGGLIQTFCNNYKERSIKIWNHKLSVDRQDILLFSFFFILACRLWYRENRASYEKEFDDINADDAKLAAALKEVRELAGNTDNWNTDPFQITIACLNNILNSFGLTEVYLPNPFDRFIVLGLISDAPMLLTSAVLESIRSERERGVLEK